MEPPAIEPASDLRRPNRFVIDLQVIGDNVAAIRRRIGPGIRLFATVKADAYGFGLIPVAKTALEAGADALSLVRLEDALALRRAGIRCPILLYAGYVLEQAHVDAIETADLWPSIHDGHALRSLASRLRRPIGCGLKIEAGQERLGIPAESVGIFMRELLASDKLRVELVHTHPHVVDADPGHLRWQFDRFTAACRAVDDALHGPVPLRIFAGTRVLALGRDMLLTAVDPGQALFRLPQSLSADSRKSPTPLAALTSRLIHVFDVRRTAYPDRSPVPIAPGSRIGIVPIGYGDGLTKLHAGAVLVRGRRVPLLSPSIEYARIDLGDCPQAAVGDEVVFIGRQAAEAITPDDVMRHTGIDRVTDLVVPIGPGIAREYRAWQRTAPRPPPVDES